MVYYGMPLGVGNLPFNLYLSVTLNALSELPASIVTFFLIGKSTRKKSLLVFAMLSGICSIGCVIVQNDDFKVLQMGFELFSFFSACTCFNVLLIYTVELFPTCVRNSAVSMVRQALVLGGAISPMLVAFGRKNRWFSYGVFGICIAICGLFVLCLPETKGRTLSDTMDEEEYKESVFVC
uniref:Sugar transporter n=2 Tax=Solanum tuberosum TaxID=4113 RepID=M1BAD6_SOLTU